MRARSVWGRLGTLLLREGADPRVMAMFYKAVSQAILRYGLKTWVLSVATDNNVEGAHMGFLIYITGKLVLMVVDGTWETSGAVVVREAALTQSVIIYMGIRQSTGAQWVVLRPIFEVCVGENCYEGGGIKREAWWCPEAIEKQLRAILVGFLWEASRRRRKGERFMQ